MGLFATSFPFVTKVALQVMILLKIGGCDHRLDTGRYSLPRDAPPAHVARDALLAPHGGRDGPGHGELGGGAGLLAAG